MLSPRCYLGRLLVLGLSLAILPAFAQNGPIQRIKMIDNELTCKQMYDEAAEMGRIAGQAKSSRESSQQASTASTVMGFIPFAGLFSGAVAVNAQNEQVNAIERMQQASARQEYLTQLFISRGCKTTDLSAPPPTAAPPAAALPPPAAAVSPPTSQ